MTRESRPNVPRRAGRPLTRSIVWHDAQRTIPVGVRVTIGDGTRRLIRFDPGTTRDQALLLGAPSSRIARALRSPGMHPRPSRSGSFAGPTPGRSKGCRASGTTARVTRSGFATDRRRVDCNDPPAANRGGRAESRPRGSTRPAEVEDRDQCVGCPQQDDEGREPIQGDRAARS